MTDKIKFSEFPLSYRLSQGSIFLGLFSTYGALKTFTAKILPQMQTAIAILVGSVILFGLVVSNYTIIRYPYLSLVATDDYFLQSFPNNKSCLYTTLKMTAIVTVFVLGFSICLDGLTLRELPFVIYLVLMFGFLVFLTFAYEPVTHPTVATFIRTTLGVGVIFFPVFLPALIIGSWRCQSLLDQMELELD